MKLPSPVQYVDAFPSAKLRLVGDDPPRYREPPADADRPLCVISPASTRAISSMLFETLGDEAATVGLSPEDATARGLRDGDVVRLENGQGHATLKVAVDPSLRPGVAMIPKGVWRKSTLDGWTCNALIPDHVDERGGGACYNDVRVELVASGG